MPAITRDMPICDRIQSKEVRPVIKWSTDKNTAAAEFVPVLRRFNCRVEEYSRGKNILGNT
jgi:hypothetical protein